MSKHTHYSLSPVVGVGVFALGVAMFSSATLNSFPGVLAPGESDDLQALSITPSGPQTVEAGSSLRFTAEGDYGTRTMPVKAQWSLIEGSTAGTLSGCSNSKTCTFVAGDSDGNATLQAEASGKTDTVSITVKKPEEALVNPFTDELPVWALEAILRMYYHPAKIVKGYEDGRYGPADPVTNGQVITLLHRILVAANLIQESQGCASYDDIPADHYAYISACTFRNQNWSTSERTFHPDDAASRGVVAGFINRVLGPTLLSANGTTLGNVVAQGQVFDDVPPDHTSFADAAVTNATGIMTGYPNGDFGVVDPFNRASAAVVMFRILNILQDRNINTLQGYKPEVGAHAVAPTIWAACNVQGDNITSPLAGAPEIGDRYAKRNVTEQHNITSIRAYCTSVIFEEVAQRYCAHGSNAQHRYQWGVLIYNQDGSIQTGGGPAGGTRYYDCPQQNAAAPTPRAACVVQGDNITSPLAGAPEIGDRYAKHNVTEQHNITSIRAYCTSVIFEEVAQRYCAHGSNAQHRYQWGVLIYNQDGSIQTGGGPAGGTRYYDCPQQHAAASTNDGDPCDDGNICTINDTYRNGVCVSGIQRVCNDNNVCTDDACSPSLGCGYSNNTATCDDGNASTQNDRCMGGQCAGQSDAYSCTREDGLIVTAQSLAELKSTVCPDGSAYATARELENTYSDGFAGVHLYKRNGTGWEKLGEIAHMTAHGDRVTSMALLCDSSNNIHYFYSYVLMSRSPVVTKLYYVKYGDNSLMSYMPDGTNMSLSTYAVSSNGTLMVAYRDGMNIRFKQKPAGGIWSAAELVETIQNPPYPTDPVSRYGFTIVPDVNGQPNIFYGLSSVNMTYANGWRHARRDTNGVWTAAGVAEAAGPVTLKTAGLQNGNLVVYFSNLKREPSTHWAFSRANETSAGTWSIEEIEDYADVEGIAIKNGDAHMIFNRTSGSVRGLFYGRSTNGGAISKIRLAALPGNYGSSYTSMTPQMWMSNDSAHLFRMRKSAQDEYSFNDYVYTCQ